MLPSHYAQTFKEMTQYGFIEGWMSSCFAPTAPPTARLIAHQLKDVQMPLTRDPLAFEEVQGAFQIQEALEEVRPQHPLLQQQLQQVTVSQGFVTSAEAMMRMLRRMGLLRFDEEGHEIPPIVPRKRDEDHKDKDKGEPSSKRRRRK